MSDPNQDAADIYANWQAAMWENLTEALDAAEADVRTKGVGFVRVKPGPVYEHVSISEVLKTAEDLKEPQ